MGEWTLHSAIDLLKNSKKNWNIYIPKNPLIGIYMFQKNKAQIVHLLSVQKI